MGDGTLLADQLHGEPGALDYGLNYRHLLWLPMPGGAAMAADAGDRACGVHDRDGDMGADANGLICTEASLRHLNGIDVYVVHDNRVPRLELAGDKSAEYRKRESPRDARDRVVGAIVKGNRTVIRFDVDINENAAREAEEFADGPYGVGDYLVWVSQYPRPFREFRQEMFSLLACHPLGDIPHVALNNGVSIFAVEITDKLDLTRRFVDRSLCRPPAPFSAVRRQA